ncbi:WD40-repeat-containing domain [Trinorchestia longiramus]|nr:WD40-repeat-containing domain [Trinorchestia longiramus]
MITTHEDHVWGAAFHPLDNNLIVTHGRGLLAVWSRRKDGIFTRTDLLKNSTVRNVLSIAFTPQGDLITGDSDGFLTVWSVDSGGDYYVLKQFKLGRLVSESACGREDPGSNPAADMVDAARNTTWYLGRFRTEVKEVQREYDFQQLPEASGGVRTATPQRPGMNDANIYVGTIKNMILEGSLQRRFNQVVFGHSRQLWGLANNPRDGPVATAGYDKQIVCWEHNKLLWRIQISSHSMGQHSQSQGTTNSSKNLNEGVANKGLKYYSRYFH